MSNSDFMIELLESTAKEFVNTMRTAKELAGHASSAMDSANSWEERFNAQNYEREARIAMEIADHTWNQLVDIRSILLREAQRHLPRPASPRALENR